MFEQHRWDRSAWIPVVTGLLWLAAPVRAESGGLVFLLAWAVGGLQLASGLALLLWPGDPRIPQSLALSGVLGALLALPLAPSLGIVASLLLLVGSAASFLAAGAAGVRQEPHVSGVPTPVPSLSLAAQVGVDEAVLGLEQFSIGIPMGEDGAHRIAREVHEARELFQARGWLDDPSAYHREPGVPEDVLVRPADSRGIAYEHLRFESPYRPHDDEPGRERWLSRDPVRTAHAWLLRHPGEERPWVVCFNGYRMGTAFVDLRAFGRFHRRLGLNLAIPVLPLHGPRRIGRQSGAGFLAGDVLDTIHAVAQGLEDARALVAWLRRRAAGPVGTLGFSLGGYHAALLAGLETLDAAVPGIPVTDVSRIFWRHGPRLQMEYLRHLGVSQADAEAALRVVSPLRFAPRVPFEARTIFGAVADRLVLPDQVFDLWEHWDRPRMVWVQGAHCTFWFEPSVQAGIEQAFSAGGLTPGAHGAPPAPALEQRLA